MKIFITGATGFIGSAVVTELLAAGHDVTGLVRSETNATTLAKLGGTPVRGSIEDIDVVRKAAESADGVIHTAFMHDGFANFAAACALDQQVIKAIGDVLAGSNRPFAITTGTPNVAGRATTESDVGDRTNPVAVLRMPAEDVALALVERGVRVSIMRMPRSVHGTSDQGWRGGLIAPLLELARGKGVSAYIGEGLARWPAVHRLDAARLYCLALDKAPAGTRVHAVAESGVTLRSIAEAIGTRLGVPVVSKSQQEAGEFFGFFAAIAATDQPSTSTQTRELFGWNPTGPELVADLLANA